MKNKTSLIKISKNFQVTLPAKLRGAFKLEEGDYLEAEVKDGAFVLKPKKLVDIDADQHWFWSDEWQKKEKAADCDVKNDCVEDFSGVADLLKDLND